jgi:hypothetical protein
MKKNVSTAKIPLIMSCVMNCFGRCMTSIRLSTEELGEKMISNESFALISNAIYFFDSNANQKFAQH